MAATGEVTTPKAGFHLFDVIVNVIVNVLGGSSKHATTGTIAPHRQTSVLPLLVQVSDALSTVVYGSAEMHARA